MMYLACTRGLEELLADNLHLEALTRPGGSDKVQWVRFNRQVEVVPLLVLLLANLANLAN